MRLLQIGFAVAAIAAGSAAMADNVALTNTGAPADPGSGPGSLFLVLYNTSNSQSVVFNTGYTVDGASPNFNFGASYTLSNIDTSLTQLTTDLGGAATSTWKYAVVTANAATTGIIYAGTEINATVTVPVSTVKGAVNGDVGSGATQLAGFIDGSTGFNSAGYLYGTASNPQNEWLNSTDGAGYGTGVLADGGLLKSGAAPGTSLSFYSLLATADDTSSPPTVTSYNGSWLFNANTDTLTWTPAMSNVPLPAGVWLLLSGLLGVGSVSRRRVAGAPIMAV